MRRENLHKPLKMAAVIAAALCITLALGLDMAVQRKLMPDAYDLGGYLYQAVGRTFAAFQLDSFTMTAVFAVAFWAARRYLFHKPATTGVGEYLLAIFFSLAMLVSASIRATHTVQTLYENGFQLIKVALFLCGMVPLFLCALRGLNELLLHKFRERKLALWDRHPFLFPFLVLLLCWVPHIIIKYPGVLMIDSCLQFRQFLNISPRITPHPPFGTLVYGLMVTFGMKIGSYNIAYFLMLLVQVFSFLAVLSYALWLMRRLNVPLWIRVLALLLFALSPNYVGWAVVIVKDSAYLILCMLAGVLLLDFTTDPKGFLKSRLRLMLLALCVYLMILTRHNGMSIAIPMLGVMLAVALVGKHGRKAVCLLLVCSVLPVSLAVGTNEAIIHALNIQRVELYDWLSIPFQQTARVAKRHGDEIPQQEKDAINGMIDFDLSAERYTRTSADPVKWTAPEGRTDADRDRYLAVWWAQLKRYPMDYVDALVNMNHQLFDLQSNFPVYIGLSDNSLYDTVYPYSFNDMSFYDSEAIRPLNSLQMALTEWYFRFSDLPVLGLFASMGFCVDVMLMTVYLTWVNRRRRMLMVWIPSLVVAISGYFCPVVYTRYLLTTMCSLPLWLAAFSAAGALPCGVQPATANLAAESGSAAGEVPST